MHNVTAESRPTNHLAKHSGQHAAANPAGLRPVFGSFGRPKEHTEEKRQSPPKKLNSPFWDYLFVE
jgi:hypothetical protein